MFYKTMKLLEENTDGKLFKSMAMIFESDTKSKRNKSRNKQERLLQTKKLLNSKENHKQNEDNVSNGRRDFQIVYPIRG